ncbi:ISAs1 family transposase [Nostoc sp. NMS7]|uniref:ISAs1 family transposase n=1 Tax=Nostoc sp. NMS7 TaxID=2815391 RepID=UPI0025D02AC5|nr:ISAs1 family transposase [Nostoc sp. NMS7]
MIFLLIITAIPELLKVLELSGCIVTIDAIGCQKEIVRLIAQQNADYVITLKKNQGNLYNEVEKLFQSGIGTGFQKIQHRTYKTEEVGHGRHEIRYYLMLSDIQERLDPDSIWSKLNSLGMVESVRNADGKTTEETFLRVRQFTPRALCRETRPPQWLLYAGKPVHRTGSPQRAGSQFWCDAAVAADSLKERIMHQVSIEKISP